MVLNNQIYHRCVSLNFFARLCILKGFPKPSPQKPCSICQTKGKRGKKTFLQKQPASDGLYGSTYGRTDKIDARYLLRSVLLPAAAAQQFPEHGRIPEGKEESEGALQESTPTPPPPARRPPLPLFLPPLRAAASLLAPAPTRLAIRAPGKRGPLPLPYSISAPPRPAPVSPLALPVSRAGFCPAPRTVRVHLFFQ
jgi:hypothetical protein